MDDGEDNIDDDVMRNATATSITTWPPALNAAPGSQLLWATISFVIPWIISMVSHLGNRGNTRRHTGTQTQ